MAYNQAFFVPMHLTFLRFSTLGLQAFEATFLRNLDAHNRRGVFLSWSNDPQGNGHVNIRSMPYVEAQMARLGYRRNAAASLRLQSAVSSIQWLKHNILQFDRVEPLAECRS